MLIKFDTTDDFADKLKALTGQNTGSKAFVIAAAHYCQLRDRVVALEAKINALEEECAVCHQTITGARDAAALLVERASQSDLFLRRRGKEANRLNYNESEY